MEGRCRRCGEKLSLLQRLQGQDFCSPEHKAEFQREQEQMALARLQQSALNLRKPLDTPRLGTRRDSAGPDSQVSMPALRDGDPPEARFLDHWKSSTPLMPVILDLDAEELLAAIGYPRAPGLSFTWQRGLTQIPIQQPLLRGDTITILSPRTSPVLLPARPAWQRLTLPVDSFPWADVAARLEGEPPMAALLAINQARPRVYEPVVSWLEANEAAFAWFAPLLPVAPADLWSASGIAPSPALLSLQGIEPVSCPALVVEAGERPLETAVRPAIWTSGAAVAASRLEPGLAELLAASVRFGGREPACHLVPASPEAPQPAPMTGSGGLAILSPMLRGPAGPARKAGEPRPGSPGPFPHFSALRLPVEPRRLTCSPDLTPISINSNWLAPTVAIPAAPVNAANPLAGSPFFVPEFAAGAASCPVSITGLDAQAEQWMIPRAAPLVELPLNSPVPVVTALTGPEGFQWFTCSPRVNSRIACPRAGVPGVRRRIKMEVQLEPPVANPWFEPLTCAFGGDPYGAR